MTSKIRHRYLALLKRVITGIHNITDVEKINERYEGADFPEYAETMIGMKRMDNIEECTIDIIENGINGDLIETGVWRGGATIFMKAILEAYGDNEKKVFVADSFEGLPPPDSDNYPEDLGDLHHTMDGLAVSLEEVKSNFEKYDLLDESVVFLKGWFKNTLPTAPIKSLSLIRLDGDMYESTMDGLVNLYPKLSVGGYLIVDDYGAVKACRKAVEDYRRKFDIREPMKIVDWTCIYWIKMEDKLNEIENWEKKPLSHLYEKFNTSFAQLFIDSGNGFNEQESIKIPISSNSYSGETTLNFDLHEYKYIERIRFDPLNESVSIKLIKMTGVTSEGEIRFFNINETNGERLDEGAIQFSTNDPIIHLENSSREYNIISLNIKLLYQI